MKPAIPRSRRSEQGSSDGHFSGALLLTLLCSCGVPMEDALPDASDATQAADAGHESDVLLDVPLDAPNVPNDAATPSDAALVDAHIDDSGNDVAIGDSATPDGPLTFWLSPDGDDALDGASADSALLTLARVHELLVADPPARDVEVRIMNGTYYGQRTRWTFTMPEHGIAFRRAGDEGRPVFDGCSESGSCPGGSFFVLAHELGEETQLTFEYLHVQRYQTAISFNGHRDTEATSNGSNTIFGCYFDRIGNGFASSLGRSTAALRLVNSDDNRIENNHFVDVINTTPDEGIIHAIYVAHRSDRNTIANNRFLRSTGDPVRVRDFSNDNVIVDNRFIQVGQYAGYTEWYCDHATRDDCTSLFPECPSWGNEFRRNTLDGTWSCDPLGTFRYFQSDTTAGCAPPTAEARRLRTSSNITTSSPCSTP